ncbi:MAG TPA: hypothetical protein ENN87_09575, partial [Phycisphaerales bacterium]|nr:hypothetical protein [Phycisphaerales bacterium]
MQRHSISLRTRSSGEMGATGLMVRMRDVTWAGLSGITSRARSDPSWRTCCRNTNSRHLDRKGHEEMNRRRFLQVSLGTAGLVLGVDYYTLGDETTGGATWAILADTHIPTDEAAPPAGHPHFGPHANLRKAVSQIARCKPVGAVFAGDLARLEGLQGDYEQLKALTAGLGEAVPAFYAMGNHDDRGAFHNVFDGL